MKILFSILGCTFLFCEMLFSQERDVLYVRQAYINSFLDAYVQAYEKKDINFIQFVFSEDAVIITETMELRESGYKLKRHERRDRKYKAMVQSKKEYIARLRNVFEANRGIVLNIADVRIVQHVKFPDVFGVSFFQEWEVSGDGGLEASCPGFVFLCIDFLNDIDNPIIQIKTWQPEKNIEKERDKYNLYDFVIL